MSTTQTAEVEKEPKFAPPQHSAANAHLTSMADYHTMYEQSLADPDVFWGTHAQSLIHWCVEVTAVLSCLAAFCDLFFVFSISNAGSHFFECSFFSERSHPHCKVDFRTQSGFTVKKHPSLLFGIGIRHSTQCPTEDSNTVTLLGSSTGNSTCPPTAWTNTSRSAATSPPSSGNRTRLVKVSTISM